MKRLALVTGLCAVSNALAHPGHGGADFHVHAEWLLVIAAIGLLWWAWKR